MIYSQYGKINSRTFNRNNCSMSKCFEKSGFNISNIATLNFSNHNYPRFCNTRSYPEQKRNFIDTMANDASHIYGWNSCERLNLHGVCSTKQSFMNKCCTPADCCQEYEMNNQCLMPENQCFPSCMQ